MEQISGAATVEKRAVTHPEIDSGFRKLFRILETVIDFRRFT